MTIHAFYLPGSGYLHVLLFICFEIVAYRLMCTVLVFFSVKCASGNHQNRKGVMSKSRWSQTIRLEPSYGDVYNQIPRRDRIWKRLSRNLKNHFDGMSWLHCYSQTTSGVSALIVVQCILLERGFFQLTQWYCFQITAPWRISEDFSLGR